jgi:hypothetical protein
MQFLGMPVTNVGCIREASCTGRMRRRLGIHELMRLSPTADDASRIRPTLLTMSGSKALDTTFQIARSITEAVQAHLATAY